MAGFCRCCRRNNHAKILDESTSVAPTAPPDGHVRGEEHLVGTRDSENGTASRTSGGAGGGDARKMGKQESCQISAQGKPFPKRPMGCKLSSAAWAKLEELFRKMDPDGSNAVSKDEARLFFKGAFGKMSADAMFNEVDVDGSGAIDSDEFVAFWIHVRKNGYKEQDILDELDELLEGGAWVDWKDGKDTTHNALAHSFPKRPLLCRLKQSTWDKCRLLFEKIDTDHSFIIDRTKASAHFVGGFNKVSVDAMFNEIDTNHHGQITAKTWMSFWTQVKSSGYSQQDISDELDNLLEGQQWVDWKDGRSTV